jgi:hypothetical protein
MNGRFVFGHCIRLSGPSQCGKTITLCKLLGDACYFSPHAPLRVMWVSGSGSRDEKVENMISALYPKSKFFYTVPESEQLVNMVQPFDFWVFDDMAAELKNNTAFTNFFTKTAHHKNCIMAYLTQNAFEAGKDAVTRTRNCAYQIYFKNKGDGRWVNVVGQQLTGNVRQFRAMFDAATPGAYDCLLVDNRADNPKHEQFWANPFSRDVDNPPYILTTVPINEEAATCSQLQHG